MTFSHVLIHVIFLDPMSVLYYSSPLMCGGKWAFVQIETRRHITYVCRHVHLLSWGVQLYHLLCALALRWCFVTYSVLMWLTITQPRPWSFYELIKSLNLRGHCSRPSTFHLPWNGKVWVHALVHHRHSSYILYLTHVYTDSISLFLWSIISGLI